MAIEKTKNKMQEGANNKGVEKSYFYPQYQTTVKATSKEEADKKVKALVNKKE